MYVYVCVIDSSGARELVFNQMFHNWCLLLNKTQRSKSSSKLSLRGRVSAFFSTSTLN